MQIPRDRKGHAMKKISGEVPPNGDIFLASVLTELCQGISVPHTSQPFPPNQQHNASPED
eukprot:282077-Pelagomonas_calceolata.AAC.4